MEAEDGTLAIKVEIVGVDCNVSPTLLMKEKRSRKLYLRSPTLLRKVKSGGAQCYIKRPQVPCFTAPVSNTLSSYLTFLFFSSTLLLECCEMYLGICFGECGCTRVMGWLRVKSMCCNNFHIVFILWLSV